MAAGGCARGSPPRGPVGLGAHTCFCAALATPCHPSYFRRLDSSACVGASVSQGGPHPGPQELSVTLWAQQRLDLEVWCRELQTQGLVSGLFLATGMQNSTWCVWVASWSPEEMASGC